MFSILPTLGKQYRKFQNKIRLRVRSCVRSTYLSNLDFFNRLRLVWVSSFPPACSGWSRSQRGFPVYTSCSSLSRVRFSCLFDMSFSSSRSCVGHFIHAVLVELLSMFTSSGSIRSPSSRPAVALWSVSLCMMPGMLSESLLVSWFRSVVPIRNRLLPVCPRFSLFVLRSSTGLNWVFCWSLSSRSSSPTRPCGYGAPAAISTHAVVVSFVNALPVLRRFGHTWYTWPVSPQP